MKLTRAQITNFRSIKELTIKFDRSCRILVGINESGKSNILKALALLDSNNKISKSDERLILSTEEPFNEASVDFVFSLSDEEINNLYESIIEIILSKNSKEVVLIKHENNQIDLKEFCKLRSSGLDVPPT